MKFTQQDKETIYNKYIAFINSMCDDLDNFSETGPKELVYAILGLVEDTLESSEDLEDTVKYWFNAYGNKQREVKQIADVVKRFTDNQEQCIFEEWLARVCPSGDCSSVHSQWLGSYEYSDYVEEYKLFLDLLEGAPVV